MEKTTARIIGKEPSFLAAIEAAEKAAPRDVPVLIYGETGSGKGRVAELIHRASGRKGKFVSLNCATFQSNLFESELFGYMKGAFTGADKDTPGLFETAAGGTLFLDEIGDTPLEIQPKLLRALEEGVVRRVGGRTEIEVNVRLVCATNRNLADLIKQGKFRADLYYRINSYVVEVPPLRKRKSDIPELARHFLAEITGAGNGPAEISDSAMRVLAAYPWPGNVRELRSAVAYAVANCGNAKTILPSHLPPSVQRGAPDNEQAPESHLDLFRELYLHGGSDAAMWARFLLALNRALGTNKFARGDVLECMRHARGPEPTSNALVNEWQRHVKPVPLQLGLIHEEGKKLRIDLDACNAALKGQPLPSPARGEEPQPQPAPVAVATAQARTNVAAARTSFVGRTREMEQLVALISAGTPNLVAITGPGGTGKTRIARELARRIADKLPGGAWFADLTEARNLEGVAYAVARALSVPLTANQPPEQLIAGILEARPPMLLVLDNFEQVVEVASDAVNDWVRHAPQVRFVVTTRALLGIEGEQEIRLDPLGVPPQGASPAEVASSDAVRLFVERARIQHVAFALTAENAPAIAALCERLEGMPLAIELAAARTAIMQPAQILQRIEESFALLKSTRRDLPERQRSLEATIDWSFDLLNDSEKSAFAQLSVFRGGFFLAAAEAVLELPDGDVVDVIQSLREKSLLRALETPYETRFAMYIAIRDYAAAKWQAMATEQQQAELASRHTQWVLAYTKDWESRTHSADAVEALDRLDYSRDNMRAVLARAKAAGDGETFSALARVCTTLLKTRGPAKVRVPLLRDALTLVNDDAARAGLLLLLAHAESEAGDPAQSEPATQQAIEIAQRIGDKQLIALAGFRVAGQLLFDRKLEEALEAHRENIRQFEEVGDRNNAARAQSRMALVLAHLGRFDEALAQQKLAENTLRAIDDPTGVAMAVGNRGTINFHATRHEDALAAYREAYDIYERLADKRMAMLMRGNMGLIARQQRRYDEAISAMEATGRMAADQGDLPSLAINYMNVGLAYLDLARNDDAHDAFVRGRDLFHRLGRKGFEAVCIENLAIVAGRRGDMKAANELLAKAMALVDQGENTLWAGVQVTRSELLLQQGDAKGALEAARQSRATLEEAGLRRSRDYYRAVTAHARALHEMKHKDAPEAAKTALLTAELLGYTDKDPSPKVREDLLALRGITL
ncbi:MAG: sigma 54-interacting transcriptional regulator [Planctomycetes bacterium]|nr:sigma 54-interacting transcriptional regulator [Planctomycetota bacterium]MCW8136772.1 sigma 54-interacting transcriptional regulator [Planctomycetota bacterium]